MSAVHGFSIAGVVAAHAHATTSPLPAAPAPVQLRDQFDADLRGDHDGPASYAWLAEREDLAHWEESR